MKCDPNNPIYAHPRPFPKKPIRCVTVGDMLKALASFHPDTPVSAGFDDGALVTLYNVGLPDEHIEIEEAYADSDEDEEEDDDV